MVELAMACFESCGLHVFFLDSSLQSPGQENILVPFLSMYTLWF